MEEYLRSFNLLSEAEITATLQAGSSRTYKKEAYFITEGQTCNVVAYIKKGIFRSYYLNDKGEEITNCFMFEGTFVTAYASFLIRQPTAETIQAITAAEVILLPYEYIRLQEQESINWLRLLKQLAEHEYLKMEQRAFALLKESAENRYQNLLMKNPEYIQYIPLQHLASYLGITQRHLSRIRRAITN